MKRTRFCKLRFIFQVTIIPKTFSNNQITNLNETGIQRRNSNLFGVQRRNANLTGTSKRMFSWSLRINSNLIESGIKLKFQKVGQNLKKKFNFERLQGAYSNLIVSKEEEFGKATFDPVNKHKFDIV